METNLVYATWALAFFTFLLAFGTFWLAVESRSASKRQIGVETWLEFEKQFDSEQIIRARKRLAKQMPYNVASHDDIDERLLNLFESIGLAHKEGYLHEKLAVNAFGFFATRWWAALEPYVKEERRRKADDDSLFEDFQDFAKTMKSYEAKSIDDQALKRFLDDERGLVVS